MWTKKSVYSFLTCEFLPLVLPIHTSFFSVEGGPKCLLAALLTYFNHISFGTYHIQNPYLFTTKFIRRTNLPSVYLLPPHATGQLVKEKLNFGFLPSRTSHVIGAVILPEYAAVS
jgi:hypothetical protein